MYLAHPELEGALTIIIVITINAFVICIHCLMHDVVRWLAGTVTGGLSRLEELYTAVLPSVWCHTALCV